MTSSSPKRFVDQLLLDELTQAHQHSEETFRQLVGSIVLRDDSEWNDVNTAIYSLVDMNPYVYGSWAVEAEKIIWNNVLEGILTCLEHRLPVEQGIQDLVMRNVYSTLNEDARWLGVRDALDPNWSLEPGNIILVYEVVAHDNGALLQVLLDHPRCSVISDSLRHVINCPILNEIGAHDAIECLRTVCAWTDLACNTDVDSNPVQVILEGSMRRQWGMVASELAEPHSLSNQLLAQRPHLQPDWGSYLLYQTPCQVLNYDKHSGPRTALEDHELLNTVLTQWFANDMMINITDDFGEDRSTDHQRIQCQHTIVQWMSRFDTAQHVQWLAMMLGNWEQLSDDDTTWVVQDDEEVLASLMLFANRIVLAGDHQQWVETLAQFNCPDLTHLLEQLPAMQEAHLRQALAPQMLHKSRKTRML